MRTTREILNLFEQIHETGKTIVLITHDPDVAEHCDRLLQIEDGHLREILGNIGFFCTFAWDCVILDLNIGLSK